MSELIGDRRANGRRISHPTLRLLVGLAMVFASSAARAGAVHHKVVKTVKAESATVSIEAAMVSAESVMNKWEPYFESALEHHSLKVKGPDGAKLLSIMVEWQGGLPDNAFVQYLEWRHSLNAERFDSVHPQLGSLLESAQIVTAASVPPTSTIISPPILGQGINPPPIQPPPVVTVPVTTSGGQVPQAPEPATLVMALIMAGSVAVARGRGKLRD